MEYYYGICTDYLMETDYQITAFYNIHMIDAKQQDTPERNSNGNFYKKQVEVVYFIKQATCKKKYAYNRN